MQNRQKNICNAESFSEISAKTIDYKVGDAYTIALLTKAVTPLQQVYSRQPAKKKSSPKWDLLQGNLAEGGEKEVQHK